MNMRLIIKIIHGSICFPVKKVLRLTLRIRAPVNGSVHFVSFTSFSAQVPSNLLELMTMRVLFLLLSLCWTIAAQAGFQESFNALKAGDYQTGLREARSAADAGDPRGYYLLGIIYQSGYGVPANSTEAFSWYEKAANGGVSGSFAKLAWAYLRGDGTAKDPNKALGLARLSAKTNDPEGLFLVYLCLSNNALGYLDANGRADERKYKQLASRPMADRVLDSEAMDALYLAAEKNYPMAVTLLATVYGGRIGDGNRKKMSDLIQRMSGAKHPSVQKYEKISRFMDTIGETYTSPQLFVDAQSLQTIAARLKACGANPPNADSDETRPTLIATSISKPLSGAVYLPSRVPGNEHSYLVAGTWEEEWQYKACGKTVAITVTFQADGLGGAHFQSTQTGKEIAGS